MASKSERLENNYIEILLATQIIEQIMQISCKSPDMPHCCIITVTSFSQIYLHVCQLRMYIKINTNYTT
jgi:hypothetical protein